MPLYPSLCDSKSISQAALLHLCWSLGLCPDWTHATIRDANGGAASGSHDKSVCERERGLDGGKGGRDERQGGEGGGGGVSWVAASRYISEGFLFQASEMEPFCFSPVGKRRRMRSSKHRHLDEETACSRTRQSLWWTFAHTSTDAHKHKRVHMQRRSGSILQKQCQSSAAQQR